MSAILTVTQLNGYTRSLLEGDAALSGLYLRGEISGFKRYPSGHCYFTLKDEGAQISACLFANAAGRLNFSPGEGLRVLARGRVSIYEQRGQYQFIADDLQPDGVGALHQQLERLKAALAAEGLFDSDRKRTLPAYPQKIGVVTSSEGAALQDILQILARRWPLAEVLLYPTAVQGMGASALIAQAIARADADALCDVLIVGRGGGSAEDLFCFNDEEVVRALAACRMPTVSAVGHETDFSLCDFAADLRAPTPSAAAELCVPDQAEERERIAALQEGAAEFFDRRLTRERDRLDRLTERLTALHPQNALRNAEEKLTALRATLAQAAQTAWALHSARLSAVIGRLDALSPLKTLARGYAIVEQGGKVQATGGHIKLGEHIDVRLLDVTLTCTVDDIDYK
ncbi:MAG: exodeoxyribonuclease VII large subunit [Oscillospiraceae bacterium]|jgi:exodeoxyribonuclease VII large subunit|nr:exodeoxyribonuclease VII large subunit [Oscillospiraceae bacterium]